MGEAIGEPRGEAVGSSSRPLNLRGSLILTALLLVVVIVFLDFSFKLARVWCTLEGSGFLLELFSVVGLYRVTERNLLVSFLYIVPLEHSPSTFDLRFLKAASY